MPQKLSPAAFRQDVSGSVAIIFALSAIVMFAVVGGALDYGRAVHARYQIQEAVDAATLAGARTWQMGGSSIAAEQAARAFYDEKKLIGLITESLQVTFDNNTLKLSMSVGSHVQTPFLSVIGINSYKVGAASSAQLTSGGTASHPVEVALMLDVTKKMSGGALQELQTAAKDFIEILLADNSGWTKIALAPYAEGVRPGNPYFDLAVANSPSQRRFEDVNGNKRTYLKTQCVAERVGSEAFTAAEPSGSDKLIPIYTANGRCTPGSTNSVTPLTAAKGPLFSAIDALQAGGLNGGHIGVGWTWYLLSPDWASVWPAGSRPGPYGSIQKIAVLMTSGEWEVAYDASGVATRDSGRNGNNGASDAYSRQLCDNMQAAGVMIFTVGFNLKEDKAIENMRRCASSPNMFYNTAEGVDLRVVYRDIALQIGKLRLVN